MKRSELFFTIITIPLDLFAAVFGFVVAYYIRKHLDPFNIIYIPPLKEYLAFLYYFLPIWVLVFSFFGLYNVKINKKFGPTFYRILFATPTALMLFVTIIFFTKEAFFSRLVILYSLVLIILITTFLRTLVLITRRILFRFGVGIKRVLIIGTNKTSKDIIDDIEKHPGKGFKIIGIVKTDNKMESLDCKATIVGFMKELGSIVTKLKPDEIIQTEPFGPQENLNIIHLCEDKRITFRYVPSLFALYSKNNDTDTFGKIPVFEIKRSNLDGWGRVFKRMIDIFGALVGIILSFPLQVLIAILIKTTSKGPVIFKQERVGRDKNYKVYKFRTMYADAEARHAQFIRQYGNMFKLKDDPRVTKIGKFLRKTSMDEIPQFYNVLKGEMSLVGPRPPMPVEVARYTREEKKRVGGVKPGLTGLWQVSGRSDVDFEQWVELDVYYIENWSLFLDIIIILKTIWVVLFRKGAY
ncbi:MAG TPA: sugar transferase [Patescibacteria group bacterium]|nr:sugar transferase [Patescibacteria group bacterium]